MAADPDQAFLTRVLALAQQSRAAGHHPFGALLIDEAGTLLAEAMNDSARDRTAHAEVNALRQAAAAHGTQRLAAATLYTSAEPCAMCAGAAYWAGVARVVYALSEENLRELTGADPENPTLSLPCRKVFARGQRTVDVRGPLREDEARLAHLDFWRRNS